MNLQYLRTRMKPLDICPQRHPNCAQPTHFTQFLVLTSETTTEMGFAVYTQASPLRSTTWQA